MNYSKVFWILFLMLAPAKTILAQQQMVFYEDKEAGVAIKHPGNWTVEKAPLTAFVISKPPKSPHDYSENLSLVIDSAQGKTLAQYTDLYIKKISVERKGYKSVGTQTLKLGSYTFSKTIYKHTGDGHALQTAHYICIRGNKAYNISCTSTEATYAAFSQIFDDMVKSFTIR